MKRNSSRISKKGGWNHYRIVCRGPEITLTLNGVLMCRITDLDPATAAKSGIIALQMHAGPPMKAEFKNILLTTFTPQGADTQPAKRIYQGGMQRRNVDNFRVAVDLARSGKLGKLHTLHAGIWLPKPIIPDLPGEPEPNPEVVDWNRWLGPTAVRPYNQTYVRGGWRYHDGFSAGWGVHDWASHTVNLCQWAIEADHTAPVEYWTENDQLCARYANGVKLVMRLAGFDKVGDWLGLGSCPVRFEGDAGWVEAGDKGTLALSDSSLNEGAMPDEMPGIDPIKHIREFLDCIKSRGTTSCNSTVSRHSEIACHAAAISWKLGRKLTFDPAEERFVDAADADALRSRPRRAPFTI